MNLEDTYMRNIISLGFVTGARANIGKEEDKGSQEVLEEEVEDVEKK